MGERVEFFTRKVLLDWILCELQQPALFQFRAPFFMPDTHYLTRAREIFRLDMRKTRVPVCPRCTWPCDSPDTHGAVLTLHDIRPRQWGETNPLARDRDSASSP